MEHESPLSETEALLGRVRQSEEGAVDALVAHVLPEIARSVADQLGAGIRASFESVDCVQDVALGLVNYLPRVRATDGRTLRALLRRMVHNTLCNKADWLVAKREQLVRANPLDGESVICLDPVDEAGPTPSEMAVGAERRAWVRLGMALLDADDQELLVRREFDGEAYEAIGAELGISSDAARMRTRRARERLTSLLERLRAGQASSLCDPSAPEAG